MSILLQNKLLAAAEAKIEQGLTPQTKINFQKIVVAGMKVGLKDGPNGIMASLVKSRDPVHDCAVGAVNLCMLLRRQSRGTAPPTALIPAATALLMQALDFAERSNLVRVGTPELVRAMHILGNEMFARFGISQTMLHNAAAKIDSITKDPAQMEKIRRASGVVKDPMASTPTPMPGGASGVN